MVKAKPIRIGNSRGIRDPKPLMIVPAPRAPRHGWDSAFQKAGSPDHDELLLDSVTANSFES